MTAEAETLRQRLLDADHAGRKQEAADLAVKLMASDPAVNIAVCSILELTIWAVESAQKRTAVMDAIRYEAMAA
jgi:hypothetical protein